MSDERRNQIEAAAKENVTHPQADGYLQKADREYWWIEGAEWADANPRLDVKAAAKELGVFPEDLERAIKANPQAPKAEGELIEAAIILRDDAEFFTGDVRNLTAWERFTNALAAASKIAEGGKDE